MSALYKWKGIEGTKYTEGKIDAINRDEAAYKLKEKKIIITSLEKISGKEEDSKDKDGGDVKRSLFGKKKVPVEEIIVFTKKLETMVRAGLPILDTIRMLEEQIAHPTLKMIVKKIHDGSANTF